MGGWEKHEKGMRKVSVPPKSQQDKDKRKKTKNGWKVCPHASCGPCHLSQRKKSMSRRDGDEIEVKFYEAAMASIRLIV